MRRSLRLALIAMPLIAVACGEDQSTAPAAHFDAHMNVADATTITQQIDDLYPVTSGHRDAAQAKWRALQDAIAKDKPNVHTKMMHLIDWTLKREQEGVLTDPNGDAPPSTRVAVSILIASLFHAVNPDAPLPSIPAEGVDFGAGVVDPATNTIIVTEASQAGAEFLAGTWTRPVLVTFVEETDGYPGDGPLVNRGYTEYPKYYQITAYPNDPTQKDIRVGICHVTNSESPYYPPEPHSTLRVAKNDEVGEGYELQILDRVEVGDFLLCYDVNATPPEPFIGSAEMPDLGMFALRSINKAFTGLASFVSPPSLYAIDQGIGGVLQQTSDDADPSGGFSLFGLIDIGTQDNGEEYCLNCDEYYIP